MGTHFGGFSFFAHLSDGATYENESDVRYNSVTSEAILLLGRCHTVVREM